MESPSSDEYKTPSSSPSSSPKSDATTSPNTSTKSENIARVNTPKRTNQFINPENFGNIVKHIVDIDQSIPIIATTENICTSQQECNTQLLNNKRQLNSLKKELSGLNIRALESQQLKYKNQQTALNAKMHLLLKRKREIDIHLEDISSKLRNNNELTNTLQTQIKHTEKSIATITQHMRKNKFRTSFRNWFGGKTIKRPKHTHKRMTKRR